MVTATATATITAMTLQMPYRAADRRMRDAGPATGDWRTTRARRVLDVTLAAFGLTMLFPVLAMLGLFVRWRHGGPVLFTQWRVGQHGRPFRLYKVRTMPGDADDALARHLREDAAAAREWEHRRKLSDDPRVLKGMRWVRRVALDEAPQLWNVLRGEMSLVGPRPVLADEMAHYGPALATAYLPFRPGLTGLWQVSRRPEAGYSHRVALDCDYAGRCGLACDLAILGRTILILLAGRVDA